jgi:hypothetical protein
VRQLAAAFLPASLLAGISTGSAIPRQQAGSRQSGSKLPHSKASHRIARTGSVFPQPVKLPRTRGEKSGLVRSREKRIATVAGRGVGVASHLGVAFEPCSLVLFAPFGYTQCNTLQYNTFFQELFVWEKATQLNTIQNHEKSRCSFVAHSCEVKSRT